MIQIFKNVICVLTIATAFVLTNPPASMAVGDYSHLYENPQEQRAFIEAKIYQYFPEPGIAQAMIAIANCESTGLVHWLPDGTLRPNIPKKGEEPSSARGFLQILFNLHRPDYERLGLDVSDIDDYMRFARHLFDTQGPENAWEQCISPAVLAALR